jgi:Ni,Fe-hydrogenase III large subunit
MTFVLPIGPQHPALKEPEHFRVEVKGEEVVDVDVRLGYVHRGIERELARRSFARGLFLSQRVCGICTTHHGLCYCQAVEQLAGVEVPERAEYARTIMAELERIQSHLLWTGVAAHEIGFDTLFMLLWRDRELVMDLRELISGNRVHPSMETLGGVRWDIRPEHELKVERSLKKLEAEVKRYIDLFTSDRTILARCEGVGVLRRQDALELCAVGPTARGSGVPFDVRRDDPYAAYGELEFEVVTEEGQDVLARALVRLREIMESIEIIREAIEAMPKGALRARFPPEVPDGEAVARVEAPRGELLYYVMARGGDKPERVRIRTPTYANLASLKPMLVGSTIADVPIVLASIDPCFSCTDRITVVDVETGASKVVSKLELRRRTS